MLYSSYCQNASAEPFSVRFFPKPTLADHLQRATAAERLEAARAIGIDIVWDSMITPTLSGGDHA